ncbi:MAG: hypothetical protein DRP01_03385 [Archaeoglobales archaeon]|nr:MAG: hypothetical protein DRP01_03385 [Archaeoglobales archaeon]
MHRIRILEFLGSREDSDVTEIAKNIRVPEVVVRSEVERLQKDGFVIVKGDRIKISERGIEELHRYAKGI